MSVTKPRLHEGTVPRALVTSVPRRVLALTEEAAPEVAAGGVTDNILQDRDSATG